MVKVLFVGVDGDCDSTFDVQMGDAIQGIVSRTTTTNYQDSRFRHPEVAQLLIEQSGVGLTYLDISFEVFHQVIELCARYAFGIVAGRRRRIMSRRSHPVASLWMAVFPRNKDEPFTGVARVDFAPTQEDSKIGVGCREG